jgi:hypothetical protein
MESASSRFSPQKALLPVIFPASKLPSPLVRCGLRTYYLVNATFGAACAVAVLTKIVYCGRQERRLALHYLHPATAGQANTGGFGEGKDDAVLLDELLTGREVQTNPTG